MQREYEPHGQQLTPALEDGPGYTGHVQDAATAQTYMQQRYYDSELGVFLSVDPVDAYSDPVEMFNRYRYANSSPYTSTDPDGRCPDGEQKMTGSRICGGGAGNNVSIIQVSAPGKGGESRQSPAAQSGQSTARTQVNEANPVRPELGSASGCMGGADCDFIYNQNQFLSGDISRSELFDRTQAQGAAGVAGGVVGGAMWAMPAAGTAAGNVMLGSRYLGPAGPIFGNSFYAGRQGLANYGAVRIGWSYNARSKQLEFALRVGKDHYRVFSRSPP